MSGMTELLLLIVEMGSRAGSRGETEGAFLASSSISPKNGRHHALCPQARWRATRLKRLSLSKGELWEESRRDGRAIPRTIVLSIL